MILSATLISSFVYIRQTLNQFIFLVKIHIYIRISGVTSITVLLGLGIEPHHHTLIMKTVIVLSTLVAVVLSRPGETYDTKYDNFNAPELVKNTRLLKNYGKCFLGQGPCTPEGTDFKKTIPDAVKTKCAKCSEKQSELIKTVIRGFQAKLPELWNELVEKEDPEHKYKAEFDSFLNGN